MLTARLVATTYLYIGDGGLVGVGVGVVVRGVEGRYITQWYVSATVRPVPRWYPVLQFALSLSGILQFCLSRDGIRSYSLPCL